MNDKLQMQAVNTALKLATSAALAQGDLENMKRGARALTEAELQMLYSGLYNIFCEAGTVIMDLLDELNPDVPSPKARVEQEVEMLKKLFDL